MPLSEATINKIKVLLFEHKKEEAESVLVTEAGLSETEAKSYLSRLEASLDKTNTKPNKTAVFIVMGVGFVMWGLAIYFYTDKNSQLSNSYLATGVVVDFIINDGAAAVISYEVAGTQYEYISNIYSNPPAFELNETVEIYIDNQDPTEITINSFINKWLLVTIFASFGLVLDLIGLLLLKLKTSAYSSQTNVFDSQDDQMTSVND
jgi:hypothetical protein